MENMTVRELIRSKFKTDAAFGLAMGWTPQKVTKLTKGVYVPKIGEAAKMSQVLSVPLDELVSFFPQ